MLVLQEEYLECFSFSPLFHTGRILTGAWGMVTIFLIMFYSSNLRQQLLAPRYEPEVNNKQDILDQGYNKIYTWHGNEKIPLLFHDIKIKFPKHYEMVSKNQRAHLKGIFHFFKCVPISKEFFHFLSSCINISVIIKGHNFTAFPF